MKYLRFVFLFSFVFCLNNLISQNADLYLVKLKSGLVLKCELIKVVPDSFVVVKQYGLESKINITEVIEINYSETSDVFVKNMVNKQAPKAILKNIPDSGWHFAFQIGLALGTKYGSEPASNFVLRSSVLKSNNKRLMYGFNLGIDPYASYEMVCGITALEGRYMFNKNSKSSGYLVGIGGYGFNLSSVRNGKDGGVHLSAGVGISNRLKSGNIFSYQFGYKYQEAQMESQSWRSAGIMEQFQIKRFEVKFEWRF